MPFINLHENAYTTYTKATGDEAMENIYYTRDYRTEKGEAAERSAAEGQEILQRLADSGIVQTYSKFLSRLPKVVVPKDKAAFERLVPKLDRLAQRHHGKIQAVVDYTDWQSNIDVYLPFFECTCPEEYELLRDIAESTNYFVVSAEGEQTHLHIMINYFDDINLYETIDEENIDELVDTLYAVRLELEQEGYARRVPGIDEADYKADLKEQIEYEIEHPEETEDWIAALFDYLMGT